MSTLFNVLFAWKCANTHHKLALDALNQSQSEQAEKWRNLCLSLVDPYLKGSKAPDNEFKDFRNHVLHVRDNNWGGSLDAARRWYGVVLESLQAKKWKDAVYAAGVLSHYFTDPFMPLHTGQTEAENIIHRACEWSIACSYLELTEILTHDLGGWPEVSVPAGDQWLDQMILAGANAANQHYEACLQHYDLKQGVKNPPAGLDQELKDRIARMLGLAAVGFARVMDRAILDSQVSLPETNLTLQSALATLQIPLMWVTKKMKDAKERAIVEATYKEFQQTGKVIESLPEDDRTLRSLHAAEVLKVPVQTLDQQKPTPIGQAHGTGAAVRTKRGPIAKPVSKSEVATKSSQLSQWVVPVSPDLLKPVSHPKKLVEPADTHEEAQPEPISLPVSPAKSSPKKSNLRYYLDRSMPVEKAPSIGPTTAKKMAAIGINTVADLLQSDAAVLASRMNDARITTTTTADWQSQAVLCCDVPCLRGHDAQILVSCGIRSQQDLEKCEPRTLLQQVEPFAHSAAGQRILRGGEIPDLAEVTDWISWAREGTRSAAA